eukprot:TRINITY_DN5621_c0_g1_i4.p1 TRINITY_DN5621_c0_g1~~TRINITY_DN5621_c0_g1_i4.p1  ORF type:complete len:749 (-),score=197.89 TRINITY_DN5621_c0_g1_i4:31-2277(-)
MNPYAPFPGGYPPPMYPNMPPHPMYPGPPMYAHPPMPVYKPPPFSGPPPRSNPPPLSMSSHIPTSPAMFAPATVNSSMRQIVSVYVGKIPLNIDNEFVRQLLESCGKVASWRRMADPINGTLKTFGYCDYEGYEGVLRVMRLLDGVAIDASMDCSLISPPPPLPPAAQTQPKTDPASPDGAYSPDAAYSPSHAGSEDTPSSDSTPAPPPPGTPPTSSETPLESKDSNGEAAPSPTPSPARDPSPPTASGHTSTQNGTASAHVPAPTPAPTPAPPPPPPRPKSNLPPLIIKVEEKTRKALDEYIIARNAEQHKIFKDKLGDTHNDGPSAGQIPDAERLEYEEDERARKRINMLLEVWREKVRKAEEEDVPMPPPEDTLPAAPDEVVEKEKAALVSREINIFRERQAQRDQQKMDKLREERERHYQEELRDEEERERVYRREKQRERDRLRDLRERERRRLEQERLGMERDSRERERLWADRERDKERERERARDRERRDKEQRLKDVRAAEEDEEFAEDRARRRHRSREQRKVRAKEREEDEADRLREIDELAAQRRLEEERRTLQAHAERMAAAHPANTEAPPAYYSPPPQSPRSPADSLATAAAKRPKLALFSTEQEEEDAQAKRRPLVMLEPDRKKRMRTEEAQALVSKIPTGKEQLFAYPIDWNIIEENNVVEFNMKPWIARKIKEYLGEEEMTLIAFIVGKLAARVPPGEILTQLRLVLDEDAEDFVVKMWRMLAFEMLASKAK